MCLSSINLKINKKPPGYSGGLILKIFVKFYFILGIPGFEQGWDWQLNLKLEVDIGLNDLAEQHHLFARL